MDRLLILTGLPDGDILITFTFYKIRQVPGIEVPGFLADNKFIGVRFHIDSKLCYGWIRVKATSTRSLKIYDFAYESTDGVGIITDSSLPVELSSFTASQAKGAINISWTTESETDNLGFILERQLKGETNWATIASYKTHTQLAGQGNKTSQTKYNFADKNVQSGNTYLYRLTDIDINGNVSSRHVITVNTTDIVLPDIKQNYCLPTPIPLIRERLLNTALRPILM